MKKITLISILIIFLSVITPPAFVFAISGACSSHNGVNCSAGADISGKVRCNDGWVNSSVSFYDTDECMAGKHLCTNGEQDSLKNTYNLSSLKSTYDNFNSQSSDLISQLNIINNEALDIPNQVQKNNANSGATDSGIAPQIAGLLRINALKYNSVKSQLDIVKLQLSNAQDAYNSAINSINQQCLSMGETTYWKNKLSADATEQQQQKDAQNKLNQQLQASSCPTNSHYNSDDSKCYCNVGYANNGSKCVTFTQNCQLSMGSNSYADNTGKCSCNTGYQLNVSQTECVAISPVTTTPPVVVKTLTITQQPTNQIPNTTITENTTEAKIQPQVQPNPKPKVSNNILSNIWGFFKNIFKRK